MNHRFREFKSRDIQLRNVNPGTNTFFIKKNSIKEEDSFNSATTISKKPSINLGSTTKNIQSNQQLPLNHKTSTLIGYQPTDSPTFKNQQQDAKTNTTLNIKKKYASEKVSTAKQQIIPTDKFKFKEINMLDESVYIEVDDEDNLETYTDHNNKEQDEAKQVADHFQSTTFKTVDFLDTIMMNKLYYTRDQMITTLQDYFKYNGQNSISDTVKAKMLKVILNNEVGSDLFIPLILALSGQYPYIAGNSLSYDQVTNLKFNSTSADFIKSKEYVKGLTHMTKLDTEQIAKDAYMSAHIAFKSAEAKLMNKSKKWSMTSRDLLPLAAVITVEYHRIETSKNSLFKSILLNKMITKDDKTKNISLTCKVISHILFGVLDLGYMQYFAAAADDQQKHATHLINQVSSIDDDLGKLISKNNKSTPLAAKIVNLLKHFIFGQLKHFTDKDGITEVWMDNCRQLITLYLLMPNTGLIHLISRMMVNCKQSLLSNSSVLTSYIETHFVEDVMRKPINSIIEEDIFKHIGATYDPKMNVFIAK